MNLVRPSSVVFFLLLLQFAGPLGLPSSLFASPLFRARQDFRTEVWPRSVAVEDLNGDGFGSPSSSVCLSEIRDCNDSNPNVYPGATEITGNKLDDDCDGLTDESCFTVAAAFGSETEGKIAKLRSLRDLYLVDNSVGKAFVDAYYQYSSPIADFHC